MYKSNKLFDFTDNNYIWSIIYAVYIYVNNTIVLHNKLSVNLLHSIPVITLALPTRGGKESQTHCFEDLLGSQHTLSCRRKLYKSSVYTFMMYCFSARPKLLSFLRLFDMVYSLYCPFVKVSLCSSHCMYCLLTFSCCHHH